MANKHISDLKLHAGANKAIKEAVRGVIEDHKRTGRPLAVWKNGKVTRISASQALRKRGWSGSKGNQSPSQFSKKALR